MTSIPSRRTHALLVSATVVALAVPSARAATGGPDGFGYTWRDSSEPGVVFEWEDVSGTGTVLSTPGEDDVNYGFQALPFAFPYYGGAHDRMAVTSNGWISPVDATSVEFVSTALPDPGPFTPVGVIAAFWDDFEMQPGSGRVLYQGFADRAVFTWDGVPLSRDGADVKTFQVVVHADGRIVVQWQSGGTSRSLGAIGIESPDQLHGLTVVDDGAPFVPPDGYRVELHPPAPRPNDLDCAAAIPLACQQRVSGDTRLGAANQDGYFCSSADFSGREQVYRIDLATPTSLRVVLTALSGDPDVVLLDGCDPNRCLAGPADVATVTASGTLFVVVDSAAGAEGAHDLRLDCFPLPNGLDCASAVPLACGSRVDASTIGSASSQDAFQCASDDHSGGDRLYRLDFGTGDLLIDFRPSSGDPDLVVLDACDPGACRVLDDGALMLTDAVGPLYLAVDSGPGDEGDYSLTVDCVEDTLGFCGDGLLEIDPWGEADGSWLVGGWLFHPFDTHSYALRVDGTTIRAHGGGSCVDLLAPTFGASSAAREAFVQYDAPEGSVRTVMTETSHGACCGLLVTLTVTNTDSAAHSYEYRVYHDTAFGETDQDGADDLPGTDDDGACAFAGPVDGGPIEIDGARHFGEVDLLSIGGDGCPGQVKMFSADFPESLRASFEMLGPNLPTTMQFLEWNEGLFPCGAWEGFVDGTTISDCLDDNSLLLAWRFPQGAGTLAPGESATASYRIGLRCAWPCSACEEPRLTTAAAVDVGPCHDGVRLSWEPATFPGLGDGVYHVYRSAVSVADAIARPPLSDPAGLRGTTYVDRTAVAGTPYHYVVQAESTERAGCGTGPFVGGSTDEVTALPSPITDVADADPPATNVGNALRATGHSTDTVSFVWPLAPAPAPDESYVVLRSDDDPRGPFDLQATLPAPAWFDPAAPPRFAPAHVWFYDVRLADGCANVSAD